MELFISGLSTLIKGTTFFKEIVLLHQWGKLDNFGFINCVTNANCPPYRVSKLTFQA